MHKRTFIKILQGGLILFLSIVIVACDSLSSNTPPLTTPPANVKIANPIVQNVMEWDEYTGHIESTNSVDIRARVSGYLQSVNFKAGSKLKKVICYLRLILNLLAHNYSMHKLNLQQVLAGNVAFLVFPLSVIFVFLALAAQYESWSLPFAVILIVPMCILSSMLGVWINHMDNNIFTQIGFIILVGLASKNAILIVEFAKRRQMEGLSALEAAKEAASTRLRPILMTSFAFIMGVFPLVVATGAGAESRRLLGTAVFGGMLGVTLFGLLLTPVFYVAILALANRIRPQGPLKTVKESGLDQ